MNRPRRIPLCTASLGWRNCVSLALLTAAFCGDFPLEIDKLVRADEAPERVVPFTAAVVDVNTAKRSWGPEQALGEPDTAQAGDIVTAWASQSPDEREEWLLLEFPNAAQADAVVVHETYNPGAIFKITAFEPNGTETVIWEGSDPTPTADAKGVSVFPVDAEFDVQHVKIYIDSQRVGGWNEIDAIGLTTEAETQWAVRAEASTTYAQQQQAMPAPVDPALLMEQAARIEKLEQQVADLREEVDRVRSLEEEIAELKKLLKDK